MIRFIPSMLLYVIGATWLTMYLTATSVNESLAISISLFIFAPITFLTVAQQQNPQQQQDRNANGNNPYPWFIFGLFITIGIILWFSQWLSGNSVQNDLPLSILDFDGVEMFTANSFYATLFVVCFLLVTAIYVTFSLSMVRFDLAFWSLFLGLSFTVVVFLFAGVDDGIQVFQFADEPAFFLIGRDITWENLGVLLSDWGRPGNLLAYLIPTLDWSWLIGGNWNPMLTRRLWSVALLAITSIITLGIAQRLHFRVPVLAMVLFWFQPFVFNYGWQSISFVPFTLYLALAVFFWVGNTWSVKKQENTEQANSNIVGSAALANSEPKVGWARPADWVWASLFFGLLPVTRYEAVPILIWWSIYLYRIQLSMFAERLLSESIKHEPNSSDDAQQNTQPESNQTPADPQQASHGSDNRVSPLSDWLLVGLKAVAQSVLWLFGIQLFKQDNSESTQDDSEPKMPPPPHYALFVAWLPSTIAVLSYLAANNSVPPITSFGGNTSPDFPLRGILYLLPSLDTGVGRMILLLALIGILIYRFQDSVFSTKDFALSNSSRGGSTSVSNPDNAANHGYRNNIIRFTVWAFAMVSILAIIFVAVPGGTPQPLSSWFYIAIFLPLILEIFTPQLKPQQPQVQQEQQAQTQNNQTDANNDADTGTAATQVTMVVGVKRWWVPFFIYLLTHMILAATEPFEYGGTTIVLFPMVVAVALFGAMVGAVISRQLRLTSYYVTQDDVLVPYEEAATPQTNREQGDTRPDNRRYLTNWANAQRILNGVAGLILLTILVLYTAFPSLFRNRFEIDEWANAAAVYLPVTAGESGATDIESVIAALDPPPDSYLVTLDSEIRYYYDDSPRGTEDQMCPADIYRYYIDVPFNRDAFANDTYIVISSPPFTSLDGLNYYTLMADDDWERVDIDLEGYDEFIFDDARNRGPQSAWQGTRDVPVTPIKLEDEEDRLEEPVLQQRAPYGREIDLLEMGEALIALEADLEDGRLRDIEAEVLAIEDLFGRLPAEDNVDIGAVYNAILYWDRALSDGLNSEDDDITDELELRIEIIRHELIETIHGRTAVEKENVNSALNVLDQARRQEPLRDSPEARRALDQIEAEFMKVRIVQEGKFGSGGGSAQSGGNWLLSTSYPPFDKRNYPEDLSPYGIDMAALYPAVLAWHQANAEIKAAADATQRNRLDNNLNNDTPIEPDLNLNTLTTDLITLERQFGRIFIQGNRRDDDRTNDNPIVVFRKRDDSSEGMETFAIDYTRRICGYIDHEADIEIQTKRPDVPVYQTATEESDLIATLADNGAPLLVISKTTPPVWYRVILPDGRTGWVRDNSNNVNTENNRDDFGVPVDPAPANLGATR